MLHAYGLGKHILVAVTQVLQGAHNLDDAVAYIDECLGVNNMKNTDALSDTLLGQLSGMLIEI